VDTVPAVPIIEVNHFRMDFGARTVIRDLTFDVKRGETFGFLGSNGSGKTTTLRALLGIYRPTSGQLLIDGEPFKPEFAHRLGYLPEERGLYKKESVIDVMTYFGRLKGLSKIESHRWSMEYLDRVDIGDKAKVRVDKLSGGQQQKVQLGVTIMNQLDEPTKGFDPVNRRLLMSIIDEQRAAGATVLMVTHQMEEVERLCDRIILLKDGAARAYGTVSEVQQQFGDLTIAVDRVVDDSSAAVPASPRYEILDDVGGHAILGVENGVDLGAILRGLVDAGVTVTRFEPQRKSLDDIFVEVYGSDEGEQ
jgi:ABC-2 type transport system ATP-binding protein